MAEKPHTAYKNHNQALELGHRIRELRTSKGFTQRDLAVEAGVDESTVYRVEKARLVITVDLLFTLANALNVQTREFFKEL